MDTRDRVLLFDIAGEQLCWPGSATAKNNWSIPSKFLVGDVVGTHCYVLAQGDFLKKENGTEYEMRKVAGILYRTGEELTQHSFSLRDCAQEDSNIVRVVCGDVTLVVPPMECDEVPKADVDNVPTPPTPPLED